MIELTKEEALVILKTLSMVEGYLFSTSGAGDIIEIMDKSVDILSDKLKGDGEEEK